MESMNKIAIVGFSGSFPGAQDMNEFYDLISKSRIGIKESAAEEVNDNLSKNFISQKGFVNIGGGPSGFKNFDAKFFGYSPKEAKYLDPQIRKALEYAWVAIEHAGYSPTNFDIPVGAYIASSLNSYFLENLTHIYQAEADENERSQMVFLNEADFLASKLAYHFNWTGPAFNLKCGCSSSLVAIHEACKGLINFDCDVALSGGVAIKPRYQYGYLYEKDGILSKDGKCSPFSDDASGTVFANGIGFVVLKRLEDAICENDTIYGIIRASAVNNDGNDKVGYMAPSVSGQVNAMETALAYADIEPQDISYIEAHGTGTEIGDPIEYKALMSVFGECKKESISLGAVKGNVGHLDAASGVTGLIKVLLDLQNETISPIANFNKPNTKIDYSNSPFKFNKKLTKWDGNTKKRIAAISSFGIGGTNAQVILEESTYNLDKKNIGNIGAAENPEYFIPVSAKTKESLILNIDKLKNYINNNETNIKNLSYTLLLGRSNFQYRVGFIVNADVSRQQLLYQLNNVSGIDSINRLSSTEEIIIDNNLFNNPHQLEKLWLSGANIGNINQKLEGCSRIAVPTYCFKEDEYWIYANDNAQSNIEKNSKIEDVSKWFYVPYWQREQIATHIPKLNNENILLLAEDTSFTKNLVRRLEKLNANVTVIASKDIDLDNKKSFIDLLNKLDSKKLYPKVVMHLWCLANDSNVSTDVMQKLGLFSLVSLCKASILVKQDVDFHLSIIADKITNVSGNELVNPDKSTLLGIEQVLPKEHDKANCQLIDIDLNIKDNLNINAILHELANKKTSDVAIRGMRRFVKSYVRQELTEDVLNESMLAPNKNYLIIGGLGNFGMELSEFIGAVNKGNIFLTSRMNFPKQDNWNLWISEKGKENSISKKIIDLQKIKAQGVNIEILKVDVTKEQDLIQAKDYIEKNYGLVSGVIHAAGIVESGMIQHKTENSLNSVFAAKIQGTKNVCEVFLKINPDFILLCSSMNSIIGGLGQLDNTAANAFVDSYAEYCLNNGHSNVLAINWGAVNEARARNYTALPQFSELSREHIKNKMTKDEIFDVYRRMFSSKIAPRIVISTIDFNKVIENWSKVGSLVELLKQVNQNKKGRTEIVSIDYKKPQTLMEIYIAELWQDLLGIDQIGIKDDFFELGGNSLIAIQFIGKLTNKYPIKIHAMSIYEYPSLEEFAAYAEQLYIESEQKLQLMDVV